MYKSMRTRLISLFKPLRCLLSQFELKLIRLLMFCWREEVVLLVHFRVPAKSENPFFIGSTRSRNYRIGLFDAE